MKKVTPKVCSMALLMRCRVTNQELTCIWRWNSATRRRIIIGGNSSVLFAAPYF
jgi:hypothetical protein